MSKQRTSRGVITKAAVRREADDRRREIDCFHYGLRRRKRRSPFRTETRAAGERERGRRRPLEADAEAARPSLSESPQNPSAISAGG